MVSLLARIFLECSLYIALLRHCYCAKSDSSFATQTSDSLWEELHVAGEAEYDRFWRMPLDEDFGPQIYSSNADLCNVRLFSRNLSYFVPDNVSSLLDGWPASW
jgi:hypothetical protein